MPQRIVPSVYILGLLCHVEVGVNGHCCAGGDTELLPEFVVAEDPAPRSPCVPASGAGTCPCGADPSVARTMKVNTAVARIRS